MHGMVQSLGTEAREFDANCEFDAVGTLARAGEEARRELWRWSAALTVALAGGAAGVAGGVILGLVTGLIPLC